MLGAAIVTDDQACGLLTLGTDADADQARQHITRKRHMPVMEDGPEDTTDEDHDAT